MNKMEKEVGVEGLTRQSERGQSGLSKTGEVRYGEPFDRFRVLCPLIIRIEV